MSKVTSGAVTAPLHFWDDKFWHHLVHRRLGEALYYYLVRIRPFDAIEVTRCLEKLLKEHRLGSVRVFPIFGSYDLMIRAWLHPSVAEGFRRSLDTGLGAIGGTRGIHTFSVENIDKRWHGNVEISRELLESLDDKTIQAVQLGKDQETFTKLIDGNLVLPRRRGQNISFFITINIETLIDALPMGIVNAIKHYLSEPHNIGNVSIYRGFGFCQILVKGDVQNYFNIAPLTTWLGTAYKPYGVHTETYLVHGSSHILGNEAIGDATFFALRGKDLFVQSIIPELYDHQFDKQGPVERFLLDEVRKYSLTNKDKRLIHDYLLAFLNNDTSGMAKTVLILFFDLESYLSKHHREFIGRKTKKPPREIYERAHLNEENFDRPALRHIFLACGVAIKLADEDAEHGDLMAGWDELADLRNDIMHGRVDLGNWDTVLRRLLPYLPRIRKLLEIIEGLTQTTCSGDYFS